jgi:Icc-related predicted phosphoesterase
VVRLLVVSDEIDRHLTVDRLHEMAPNLVVSCGDLPADYLDFVSSAANAVLLRVPGNHDPAEDLLEDDDSTALSPPGFNLDKRVLTEFGLRIAGLGGSIRYRPGPNQYTQAEMRRRVRSLIRTARIQGLGRAKPIDVFVSHAPPRGVGDDVDEAHQGFDSFHRLIEVLQPRFMVHGHTHPYGLLRPDRQIGATTIINAVPHRLLEIQ